MFLIVGASGFIGNKLYNSFKRNGLEVKGTYYSRTFEGAERDGFYLDLSNPDFSNILGLKDLTHIIFCSAITPYVEDSWDAMLKNITMVHNFTSNMTSNNLRSIVFLSSVDVYGVPPETLPINEDTKPNPHRHYALSKLVCETLLGIEPTSKCVVTILRPTGIYGAGDRSQSIIGRFITQILSHKSIDIFGDGTSKRDFVEVGDLCQVVEHFLWHPFNGIVNVATGKSTAIKDLVTIAATAVGIKPNIKLLPATSIQGDLVFDTTRLMSLCPNLQFKDLKQGVKEYVSHLRS